MEGFATYATTLSLGTGATLSATARSAGVASISRAPAAPFRVRIDSELLWVTRVRGGGSPRLYFGERGIEGTTAASHRNGAPVRNVVSGVALRRLGQPKRPPAAYVRNAATTDYLATFYG